MTLAISRLAKKQPRSNRQYGFTLIEIVVGIVVSSFALTFLATLFFAAPERSVAPTLQIRAAEFGQALMDEILAKKFDQLTPEGGIPACTVCSVLLGPEGEARDSYDDVDDYQSYCEPVNGVAIENVFGNLPVNFENYRMSVCVNYDGDFDGVADTNSNAKLIVVDLFPPASSGLVDPITISAYRSNY